MNTDVFPGQDAGRVEGPLVVGEVQEQCLQRGCGGFVTWRGTAFLRKHSTAELCANLQSAESSRSHVYLPIGPLALGCGIKDFSLPTSLPEVHVKGAKGVEKLSGVPTDAMTARFYNSRPAVLLDAQQGWVAREKWNFEWFAEKYGDEPLICSDLAPFFKSWGDGAHIRTITVPMREYVRYVLCQPNAVRPLQRDREKVFYANAWAPFNTHDKLLEDVSDFLYCVQDTIPREAEARRFNLDLTKIFFGPAGTVSRLHHDTYATHVWLSQIRGRKQFICYPPEDADKLHCKVESNTDGRTSLFNPAEPDYEAYPKARLARPFSVVVEEGETVVLPCRWFHWAKSLTESITLMRNFVNETNVQEHFRLRKAATANATQQPQKC